jgi:hypothetical protein
MLWGCLLVAQTPASIANAPATPKAASSKARGDEALRVLDAAHRFLGGASRLHAVKTLELKQSRIQTLRLLFPDRYQIENATPSGSSTLVSFDGERMRLQMPPALQFTRPPMPDTATQRRRAVRNVSKYALTYLVRTLSVYPLTAKSVGIKKLGEIEGNCVEFIGTGSSKVPFVRMVFDSTDGRPLAIVELGNPETGDLVSTLDDYREVDGIRFPFRVSDSRIKQDGSRQQMAVWRHEAVSVNPAFTAATFQKGTP